MGGEIGQWNEWNCKREMRMVIADSTTHHGIQSLVKRPGSFLSGTCSSFGRRFTPIMILSVRGFLRYSGE